jgi:hypothetical protein
MSTDAVVTSAGELTFTEVNARVGGSLHLYQVIAHRIVNVHNRPERTVGQYLTAAHWKIRDLDHFLAVTSELGVDYDPATRKGVLAAMPLAGEPGRGGLLFCVAYAERDEQAVVFRRLDDRLS